MGETVPAGDADDLHPRRRAARGSTSTRSSSSARGEVVGTWSAPFAKGPHRVEIHVTAAAPQGRLDPRRRPRGQADDLPPPPGRPALRLHQPHLGRVSGPSRGAARRARRGKRDYVGSTVGQSSPKSMDAVKAAEALKQALSGKGKDFTIADAAAKSGLASARRRERASTRSSASTAATSASPARASCSSASPPASPSRGRRAPASPSSATGRAGSCSASAASSCARGSRSSSSPTRSSSWRSIIGLDLRPIERLARLARRRRPRGRATSSSASSSTPCSGPSTPSRPSPTLGYGAPTPRRARAARRKKDETPFYEKVNRFFFGPDVPPPDPREMERRILAEIRAQKGRIGLADVIRVTGLPARRGRPAHVAPAARLRRRGRGVGGGRHRLPLRGAPEDGGGGRPTERPKPIWARLKRLVAAHRQRARART